MYEKFGQFIDGKWSPSSNGEAYEVILRGDADIMLAGGAEAPFCETTLGGFCNMHALTSQNENTKIASNPALNAKPVITEILGAIATKIRPSNAKFLLCETSEISDSSTRTIEATSSIFHFILQCSKSTTC